MSAPLKFRCEHCSQMLSITRKKPRSSVNCPACKQRTAVPPFEVEPDDAPPPAAKTPPRAPASPPEQPTAPPGPPPTPPAPPAAETPPRREPLSASSVFGEDEPTEFRDRRPPASVEDFSLADEPPPTGDDQTAIDFFPGDDPRPAPPGRSDREFATAKTEKFDIAAAGLPGSRDPRPASAPPHAGDDPWARPKDPWREGVDPEEDFQLASPALQESGLDMTPMVDVTFLLLIFFMITASFSMQKSLETTPPKPEEEGAAASVILEDLEQDSIVVAIDEENVITVDDEPVAGIAELTDVLIAKIASEGKTEMLIEVHRNAKHGTVVAVTDAGIQAQMQKIRRSTKGDD